MNALTHLITNSPVRCWIWAASAAGRLKAEQAAASEHAWATLEGCGLGNAGVACCVWVLQTGVLSSSLWPEVRALLEPVCCWVREAEADGALPEGCSGGCTTASSVVDRAVSRLSSTESVGSLLPCCPSFFISTFTRMAMLPFRRCSLKR